MSRIELARKCRTCGPCRRNPRGLREDGAGGSGHVLVNYDRESFIMTGLSLGPRGSGAVNTVAASGNPSLAGQAAGI